MVEKNIATCNLFMGKTSTKICLISGFDPEGNKGLLRDLQAFSRSNIEINSAITTLVSQADSQPFIKKDLDKKDFENLLKTLLPLSQYKAIKIGALGSEEIIKKICKFLKQENKKVFLILDPIIQSSTGKFLLNSAGIESLKKDLAPLSYLITPNVLEAEVLSGLKVKSVDDVEKVAKKLYQDLHTNILITGFRFERKVGDFYCDGKKTKWFWKKELFFKRKSDLPIRGTGCYYSSLITKYLAQNNSLVVSIQKAKNTMHEWLKRNLNL